MTKNLRRAFFYSVRGFGKIGWVVTLRELSWSIKSIITRSSPSLSRPHDLNLEWIAAPSHGEGSRFWLDRLPGNRILDPKMANVAAGTGHQNPCGLLCQFWVTLLRVCSKWYAFMINDKWCYISCFEGTCHHSWVWPLRPPAPFILLNSGFLGSTNSKEPNKGNTENKKEQFSKIDKNRANTNRDKETFCCCCCCCWSFSYLRRMHRRNKRTPGTKTTKTNNQQISANTWENVAVPVVVYIWLHCLVLYILGEYVYPFRSPNSVHTEGFSWKELRQGLDHGAPSIVRFIPLNSSVTLLLWHVCISTAQARTECGSRSRDPSGARHFFCKFWHELALVTCHVKTLLYCSTATIACIWYIEFLVRGILNVTFLHSLEMISIYNEYLLGWCFHDFGGLFTNPEEEA